jgi:hypothetical protein
MLSDYPLEDDTVRLGGHQVIVTYSVRVRQDTATIDICNQVRDKFEGLLLFCCVVSC